jgi:hypothetical protein
MDPHSQLHHGFVMTGMRPAFRFLLALSSAARPGERRAGRPDSDAFGPSRADTDIHGHADTFGNAHRDCNARRDTERNTNSRAEFDTDTRTKYDAYGCSERNTYAHADTHGDANGDTGCRDRSLSLLQGEDCAGFRSLRKARSGAEESVHRINRGGELDHELDQAPAILQPGEQEW